MCKLIKFGGVSQQDVMMSVQGTYTVVLGV